VDLEGFGHGVFFFRSRRSIRVYKVNIKIS
jgi:hypothetical protein